MSDPELPPPLREALRQLAVTDPVPGRVDDAVRRAARERLAAPARPRPRLRLAGVVALAAAAGIAVLLWPWDPERRDALVARGDVDESGIVDILDAFVLARTLRDRGAVREDWDLTGDGTVDAGDVDAVAQLAVRIDAGDER